MEKALLRVSVQPGLTQEPGCAFVFTYMHPATRHILIISSDCMAKTECLNLEKYQKNYMGHNARKRPFGQNFDFQ